MHHSLYEFFVFRMGTLEKIGEVSKPILGQCFRGRERMNTCAILQYNTISSIAMELVPAL